MATNLTPEQEAQEFLNNQARLFYLGEYKKIPDGKDQEGTFAAMDNFIKKEHLENFDSEQQMEFLKGYAQLMPGVEPPAQYRTANVNSRGSNRVDDNAAARQTFAAIKNGIQQEDPSKLVWDIQKHLFYLGLMPNKPNGKNPEATRQALQKFADDQKMTGATLAQQVVALREYTQTHPGVQPTPQYAPRGHVLMNAAAISSWPDIQKEIQGEARRAVAPTPVVTTDAADVTINTTKPEARPSGGRRDRNDIAKTQAYLVFLGHDPGTIDGVMGGNTQGALDEFAAKNGVDPADSEAVMKKLKDSVTATPQNAENIRNRMKELRDKADKGLASGDEVKALQSALMANNGDLHQYGMDGLIGEGKTYETFNAYRTVMASLLTLIPQAKPTTPTPAPLTNMDEILANMPALPEVQSGVDAGAGIGLPSVLTGAQALANLPPPPPEKARPATAAPMPQANTSIVSAKDVQEGNRGNLTQTFVLCADPNSYAAKFSAVPQHDLTAATEIFRQLALDNNNDKMNFKTAAGAQFFKHGSPEAPGADAVFMKSPDGNFGAIYDYRKGKAALVQAYDLNDPQQRARFGALEDLAMKAGMGGAVEKTARAELEKIANGGKEPAKHPYGLGQSLLHMGR